MKKKALNALKCFCPHFWKYRSNESRVCKVCGRKEVIRPHMEIIPAGLGVMTVTSNRWEKE